MKHDRNAQGIDLTGRIKSLEQFTGALVARPGPETTDGPDADVIPIHEAPRSPRAGAAALAHLPAQRGRARLVRRAHPDRATAPAARRLTV